MAVNLSPYGGVGAQFLDNSGNVLTGGKIYTYQAGTTTPQPTYTTSAGNIPHSNPIILDASGRVPSGGEIWLTDGLSYKFILRDANDVLIATYDNVIGINSNFVNFTNQQEIQTATAGQTVFNLTTTTYQPGTNSLSVFVDGVNQYGPGAQYAYLETDSDTVTFVNGLHVGAEVKFTTSQLNSSASTNTAAQVSFTGFKGQVGNVQDLAGNDGSDWIGFEPSGVNAVARSAQDKMRDVVSVKDFGAVGDGVADDTVAIQNAINYVQGLQSKPTIVFPVGTYKTTATLTITEDCVSLVGLGTPVSGQGSLSSPNPGVTRGATILYMGTDEAILIGVAPFVNGTFINEIWVENLRIELQNNSKHGLYVWMCTQSYFKNINIFGNKSSGAINQFNGTGNTGMTIAGSLSTIVEQIDITGYGQTNGNTTADYLNYGLSATSGFGNSPMTTTTFRKCYLHYCNVGAFVANLATFEDCIFEANDIGITIGPNAEGSLYRGWWEANVTYDVAFAGNNSTTIRDGRINAYTRQQFFNSGAIANLTIEDSLLFSSDANPYLFEPAIGGSNIFNPALTYAGSIVLNRNILPTNFQIGNIYNNNSVNLIQVENMRKETYRFVALSLAAATTVYPMQTGDGFTKYVMPEDGHIISFNIYTSSAISAGTWSGEVRINGTAPTNPIPGILTSGTSPFEYRQQPYLTKFNKGDILTFYISSSSGWSPTNDVCVEVTVALGPDGVL